VSESRTPGILLVLDGWGRGPDGEGNALANANTPTLDTLVAEQPSALLAASGDAVGLLPGTVGNSEIGHLVIGAGRPLLYDSLLVQRRIDAGELANDEQLTALLAETAKTGKAAHLVGLCSDGQIHAHLEHLGVLLEAAARAGLAEVWIHAITDGRDVADGTAHTYLDRVRELAAKAGVGRIATVVGRGYALDKAGDLELTRRAGLAIADGGGKAAADPADGVAASERGDEWVEPTVLPDAQARIADGDALVLFNFRSDRIQQLADFLLDHLAESGRTVRAVSLARYDTRNAIPPLVDRADASGGLADELETLSLRSVRIAEREKFEHVTYYVNGRDARRREVEEHVLIKGDQPPDYRAEPRMNLPQVASAVIEASARPEIALVVANLANIDVVGHTGDYQATVRAAEHTDEAVAKIVAKAAEQGRWVLLVGDHGNAEQMTKTASGTTRPYGGHTTNPVPVVLVPAPDQAAPARLSDGGTLADIAPTILALLGRKPGARMEGKPLL
jgi:2,3-bisphosphoglycerate-independent phosphoglycerate mutase